MKKLALLAFLLAATFPLRADDLLQNGDFSDGISHWYGDCHTVADMTSQDSDYQAPPSATNGAVVKLRAGEWTKLTQDFDTKAGTLKMSITYVLSPGLTFSQSPEDYTNTTGNVGYTAWRAFPTSVGLWVVMLCDIAAGHANVFQVPPSNAASGPQTFTAGFLARSDEQKSLCLGFPPGKGFITIEKASVTTSQ